MAADWKFPEVPFNIEDKTGTYPMCIVVGEDSETLIFDYTAATTGARMRLQLLKENIVMISYPTPTVDQLQAMMNRKSNL